MQLSEASEDSGEKRKVRECLVGILLTECESGVSHRYRPCRIGGVNRGLRQTLEPEDVDVIGVEFESIVALGNGKSLAPAKPTDRLVDALFPPLRRNVVV